ncbi:hypothetical protein [Xanthomonas sacchari]|uniref:hypothetical protein n=1 Tax=Xanthomonas sacchari TaxID=56458 RepID=UPI0011109966|nr:hypothetical protein [Xanthomonas sacchari]MDV0438647.1 hypothetical protein [Xanthomonas sacchari]
MSAVDQFVGDVRQLLDLLTDVEVLRSRVSGDTAIFEIVRNVSFEPDSSSDESVLFGLAAWNIAADTRGFDTVQHGYLHLLAIHLAWHLHAIGAIPAQVANELLDTWHGGRIGA